MKTLHTSISAMLSVVALAAPVHAQQLGSTTIQAQTTVPIECRVTATTHIVFPNYDILDKNSGGVTVTAPAAVGLRCTGGGTFSMLVGGGLHPSNLACGDYRRMKNENGNYLDYTLTRPLVPSSVWNIYNPARCETYGNNHVMYNVRSQTVSFSARIKPYQYTARVGQYTDTLTVYLIF